MGCKAPGLFGWEGGECGGRAIEVADEIGEMEYAAIYDKECTPFPYGSQGYHPLTVARVTMVATCVQLGPKEVLIEVLQTRSTAPL